MVKEMMWPFKRTIFFLMLILLASSVIANDDVKTYLVFRSNTKIRPLKFHKDLNLIEVQVDTAPMEGSSWVKPADLAKSLEISNSAHDLRLYYSSEKNKPYQYNTTYV